jgi:hypothetical protein
LSTEDEAVRNLLQILILPQFMIQEVPAGGAAGGPGDVSPLVEVMTMKQLGSIVMNFKNLTYGNSEFLLLEEKEKSNLSRRFHTSL